MRGADSLAGALAIPFVPANREPFPGRDLILLLTFCVIFGTLVLQGLTLTPLVRWLKVVDEHVTEKEERLARLKPTKRPWRVSRQWNRRIGPSPRPLNAFVRKTTVSGNCAVEPHMKKSSADCSRQNLRNWPARYCKQNATP